MRLLFAALFVVIGLTLTVAGLGQLTNSIHSPWMNKATLVALPVAFVFLLALASRIFSETHHRSPRNDVDVPIETHDAYVARLEADGLLVDHEYRATRAMKVTDFEHGNGFTFVDTVAGVLFLTWGFDDDFDEGEYSDDPAKVDGAWPPPPHPPLLAATRYFDTVPKSLTTEFTVRLHRQTGVVVDIVCRGERLPVECLEESADGDWYFRVDLPDDGALIADRTYEEIRHAIVTDTPRRPKRIGLLRSAFRK